MTKVKLTMGTTYCGCVDEEFEFEYDGTKDEFYMDDTVSTDILNMIFNGEFPHYFLDFELEEIDEEE